MFELLQPILLFSAAGIIVPVFIHLWNTRKGRTRKVGSIMFFQESARSMSRSLRLTDLPLLFLRCLLIAVLAILLAHPVWIVKRKVKGWVVVDPAQQDRIYTHFKKPIDSLVAAGFEYHALDTGFSRLQPGEKSPAQKNNTLNNLSYWSLLKHLNGQLPADLPVYLYTGRELARFSGVRPRLSLNLHWQTISTGDKDTAGLSIRRLGIDSLLHTSVQSSSNAAFLVSSPVASNRIETLLKENHEIHLDTASIQVLIYSEGSGDGNYIASALEAIKKETALPLAVARVQNIAVMADCQWLFWLSSKPIPANIHAQNIFRYAGGKVKEVNSYYASNTPGERVKLTRLITGDKPTMAIEPVWMDSKGQTILGHINTSPASYLFYSRFRPDWDNLVWDGAFAEKLFYLLSHGHSPAYRDKRDIDPSQVAPAKSPTEKTVSRNLQEHRDLASILWLLAVILFAMERFLASKQKKGAYVS